MRFGTSYADIQKEPKQSTSNGDWIKNFKAGDTVIRILQEPDAWQGWWEHYNPGGFPFPCTGERSTCPGCTSENPKMQGASRKIGINVLEEGKDGKRYIAVYKFNRDLADRLALRAERAGTATDRDYVITRIGTDKDTKYDIEGQDKEPLTGDYNLKDIEQMLADAYEQAWGEGVQEVKDPPKRIEQPSEAPQVTRDEEIERLRAKIAEMAPQGSQQAQTGNPDDPPSEPEADDKAEGDEYTVEQLQAMDPEDLIKLIENDPDLPPLPDEVKDRTSAGIVEWIVQNVKE